MCSGSGCSDTGPRRVDQTRYIGDVQKEFGHLDCKPVSTPTDSYEHLQSQPEGTQASDVA
jgi:hypothetical protein